MDDASKAVLVHTQRWLTRAVIGLNLCPFAKHVVVKKQIRYAVSLAVGQDEVLADLEAELLLLNDSCPARIDTTLLIIPYALSDFFEYNQCLDHADRLLGRLRLTGAMQIASFHPNYQFSDSGPEDIENFTNRAPYPILHILREASVDRAVAAFPDAACIYERNQETMRRLGLDGWYTLMRADGGP